MDNKLETQKGIPKVKLTNIPEELQTHKQWVATIVKTEAGLELYCRMCKMDLLLKSWISQK